MKAAKQGIKKEYLIIGGLGVAAVLYATMGKKSVDTVSFDTSTAALPASTTPTSSTVTLNNSLTLKSGSTGNEVKRLQTLLGVTVDGIFGPVTEAALYSKKGVRQITLAAFSTTANINSAALAIGNSVMANGATAVTVAATNAKGEFYDSGVSGGTFAYGAKIGTIVSMTATKNIYVVRTNSANTLWHDVDLWVKAADVIKI